MKPQLVVDHCSKEKELEEMTLAKYGHDIRQLLTSMQEKKNEIDTICKGGVKFYDHLFLTLVFDCLALEKFFVFVPTSSARIVLG